MKRITVFLVALLFLVCLACAQTWHAAQSQDMLEWVAMTPALADSYHFAGANGANPLFTTVWPGKYYQVKSDIGFPWDINLYDQKYVYLWITELDWSNAATFKKFHAAAAGDLSMPLLPRYLVVPSTPGKLATIKVSDSSYEYHSSCNQFEVKSLGHVINEVWGPYQEYAGITNPDGSYVGDVTALDVSYRYNCDSQYSQCKDKEVFHVAKPYGLFHWEHFSSPDGKSWTLENQTQFKNIVAGTVSPVFPCF